MALLSFYLHVQCIHFFLGFSFSKAINPLNFLSFKSLHCWKSNVLPKIPFLVLNLLLLCRSLLTLNCWWLLWIWKMNSQTRHQNWILKFQGKTGQIAHQMVIVKLSKKACLPQQIILILCSLIQVWIYWAFVTWIISTCISPCSLLAKLPTEITFVTTFTHSCGLRLIVLANG